MERDGTLVTGWILLLLALWLSFAVHQSPRFPGSPWGGVLGVSAAVLMLVPLAYAVFKRVDWLKERFKAWLPLSRLMAWHVNASIGGAFLAILHSGHRYESALGILLTAVMLFAVASGYVGRHFLRYLAQDMHERQGTLLSLRAAYDHLAAQIAAAPKSPPLAGDPANLRRRAVEVVEAIADTEYAIAADETLKRRLRIWLALHVAASVAFYVMLALHIWSGIWFGLRWFS